MASLTQIRDGVKTTLEAAIATLKVYPRADVVNAIPEGGAAVVVVPTAADFIVAMGRGVDTWSFDLLVMVNPSDLDLAQRRLDAFVTGAGSTSIRQAIFNSSLGLTGTSAYISGLTAGSYGGRFESAGVDHLGAVLELIVHTPGTS